MSSRITEPPGNLDAFSPGDTVIGGREAAFYKDGSLTAFGRPRAGVPAQEAAVAPEAAPLPLTGVARAAQAQELQLLRQRAQDRRAWLNGSGVGMTGIPMSQVPGHAERRSAVAAELAVINAEIERLTALNDQAVRAWAGSRGVR